MAPATVTFSNVVDPTALVGHITVTVTPAAGAADDDPRRSRVDGRAERQRRPAGKTADGTPLDWPADSTIVIKVDATTPDVVGDTLGADVTSDPFPRARCDWRRPRFAQP